MPVMDDTAPLNSSALSRQQILDATARCLREDGYDACTIRRIASRLDCAVGSIYRYYRHKRDLLFTVAQAALEPAAALVEAGGSVEVSARLYHDLVSAEPGLYRLMFWLAAVGDGPAGVASAQAMPRVVRRVINGWSQRLGDGELATRCWLIVHGCVTLGTSAEAALAAVSDELGHRAIGGNGHASPAVTRIAALQAEPNEHGETPRPLRPALGIFSDNGEDGSNNHAVTEDVEPSQTLAPRSAVAAESLIASRSAKAARQREQANTNRGAQAMPDDVVLL